MQRIYLVGLLTALYIFCGASVTTTQAALINLQAYVTFALLEEDGLTPLADGSIVQIIGSGDDIIDPIATFGTNVTGGVTGDDLLLGTVTIQSSQLGSNGTFFAGNIFFETDDINYMYLRFYNTTGPLTGLIYWGETVITNINHDEFGVVEVDFVGDFATTNVNNFVVIPEPGSLQFILFGGVLLWMFRRASIPATRPPGSAFRVNPPEGEISRLDPGG